MTDVIKRYQCIDDACAWSFWTVHTATPEHCPYCGGKVALVRGKWIIMTKEEYQIKVLLIKQLGGKKLKEGGKA